MLATRVSCEYRASQPSLAPRTISVSASRAAAAHGEIASTSALKAAETNIAIQHRYYHNSAIASWRRQQPGKTGWRLQRLSHLALAAALA